MATKEMSQVGISVMRLFDKLTDLIRIKAWYASHEDCPPIAHDLISEDISDTIQEIRDLAQERSKL